MLEREPAGGWLSQRDAEDLLASYGVRFAVSYPCRTLQRALAAAADIGGPVTLKVELGDGTRARDVAATFVGLEGESALRSGWHELQNLVQDRGREWNGAIVAPHVGAGVDVVVGAFRDHDLGPVIALLTSQRDGGNRTTACRRPPATDVEVDELMDAAEGGFRAAPIDRDGLRELILRFSCLVRDVPEVAEAELSPVRCRTDGALVLGMRVRVERRRPVTRVKTW